MVLLEYRNAPPAHGAKSRSATILAEGQQRTCEGRHTGCECEREVWVERRVYSRVSRRNCLSQNAVTPPPIRGRLGGGSLSLAGRNLRSLPPLCDLPPQGGKGSILVCWGLFVARG